MMNKPTKNPNKEKKRPAYKPKPKQSEMNYKEPEIHEIAGIRYIMLGNTPYAVDDKGVIDYAETAILRKILGEEANQKV